MRNVRFVHRAPLAAALLFGAWSAEAQQPVRASSIRRDSASVQRSDSGFLRVMVNTMTIDQMIREVMASRDREIALVRAMREAAASDQPRKQQIELELTALSARSAGLLSRIQMECDPRVALPQGYMGVNYTVKETGTDSPDAVVLIQYPALISVEPGSPANKAGLRPGDVLMSVGNLDTRSVESFAPVLIPGSRVPVKFKRDGAVKEVTVVIAKRPDGYGPPSCAGVRDLINDARMAPVVRMNRTPNGGAVASAAPQAVIVQGMPAPAMAGQMAGGNYVFSFTPSVGNTVIAGAQLQVVDDDWRQQFGVEKGLGVITVATGSPASESGLHKFDVIISADDSPVTSTATLRRIMSNTEGSSIKLVVVRSHKQQTITLRWQ